MGVSLFVTAIPLAGFLLLAILPFLNSWFLHDPNNLNRIALFVKAEPGTGLIVLKGGDIDHEIHGRNEEDGTRHDEDETFSNAILSMYDSYSQLVGVRFIGIPKIHQLKVYKLGRYTSEEAGGKIKYSYKEDHSNHWRTQLSPWYLELESVDIEGIPFTVHVVMNVTIRAELLRATAYSVESWNLLLGQVAAAKIRAIMRKEMTLELALGKVSTELDNPVEIVGDGIDKEISATILREITEAKLRIRVKNGQFKNKTLEQVGIHVATFDIKDYAPERLSEKELAQLRAPVLERQKAIGRRMAGLGEAAYQRELLGALGTDRDLAKDALDADARVKMAQGGGLDALLAQLTNKLNK